MTGEELQAIIDDTAKHGGGIIRLAGVRVVLSAPIQSRANVMIFDGVFEHRGLCEQRVVSPTKTSADAHRKVRAKMHPIALAYLNTPGREDDSGHDQVKELVGMLERAWDDGFETAMAVEVRTAVGTSALAPDASPPEPWWPAEVKAAWGKQCDECKLWNGWHSGACSKPKLARYTSTLEVVANTARAFMATEYSVVATPFPHLVREDCTSASKEAKALYDALQALDAPRSDLSKPAGEGA